jgi:hypothetical protein
MDVALLLRELRLNGWVVHTKGAALVKEAADAAVAASRRENWRSTFGSVFKLTAA